MEVRDRINLKFWQGSGDLLRIAGLLDSWWDKVQEYLSWITLQTDAETAPMALVNLLAWQRDITRLANEPDWLFRRRVKYALANALDAGCSAGFVRIWERLGLGYVGQNERIDAQDWDVIELVMTESSISNNPDLLETIIRQYGRTCRRYTLTTIVPIGIRARSFDFDHVCLTSVTTTPEPGLALLARPVSFYNDSTMEVARP